MQAETLQDAYRDNGQEHRSLKNKNFSPEPTVYTADAGDFLIQFAYYIFEMYHKLFVVCVCALQDELFIQLQIQRLIFRMPIVCQLVSLSMKKRLLNLPKIDFPVDLREKKTYNINKFTA